MDLSIFQNMYTPKTTQPWILLFAFIFWGIGLSFLWSVIGDISLFHASFTKGEILTYSTSPKVRYFYQDQEYTAQTEGSMSCNKHPCNQVWETITILVDTQNPNICILLWELLFLLIFPAIWGAVGIGWLYAYIKSKKKRDIISLLQSQGAYKDTTIIDMETVRSKSKNGWSRIIGYKYICRDLMTGEHYDSDIIPNPVFEIGSTVKVVKDTFQYPWIYWVDLNTVTANATSHEIAQQYQEKENLNVRQEIRKTMSSTVTISYKSSNIFFIFLAIFFIWVGIIAGSIGMIILWIIFLGLIGLNIPYMLREKKSQRIREKNIASITNSIGVEKVWSWKFIPLWYIPENEKQTLEIGAINDGVNQSLSNVYGYRYCFLVNVNGIIKKTEIFSKPFPEKYKEWVRVRLYFDDISQQGDFVMDFASIDELN